MFTNAIKIFTFNKFDIKIDPSWLVIAALVTWSLSQQYFPEALPTASQTAYLAMGVFAMLGLFASLLLHELAHSVVARRLGVPINSITLFLFGGVAELEEEPGSAPVEFWIAVAGPVMSLFLAFSFWTLELMATFTAMPAELIEVLSYLALINLVLALFNLLPAFPLDGGRVLRAYLWSRSGDILTATRAASQSGVFLAFLMMGFGMLALFQGALAVGLWQLMIGGFILIAARTSYAAQLAKIAFDGETVGSLMTTKITTATPDTTLSEYVNQIVLRERVTFVPVTDGEVLLGHMDQSVLSSIDRENWANTRVGDVFVGLDQSFITHPDVDVQDLLDTIAETGHRKFMVASDHRLLGVITLSDLTHFLSHSAKVHHLTKAANLP